MLHSTIAPHLSLLSPSLLSPPHCPPLGASLTDLHSASHTPQLYVHALPRGVSGHQNTSRHMERPGREELRVWEVQGDQDRAETEQQREAEK